MILLIFPVIYTYGGHSSTPEYDFNIRANNLHIGLPFPYLSWEYDLSKENTTYFTRFSGSYLSFILDIIIAYFICVLLSIVYSLTRKKSSVKGK